MVAPSASISASYSIASSALVWIVRVAGSIQPSSPTEQRRAGVVDDRRERIAVRGAVGERLADDHRAVDELAVGSDDGHLGAVGREIGQGERRLEGGYSPAGDDHRSFSERELVVGVGLGLPGMTIGGSSRSVLPVGPVCLGTRRWCRSGS